MIALDLSLATIHGQRAGAAPVAPLPPITAINAEGWSAEWREGTPPAFEPDTAPQTIPVARAGFDAGGAPASHAAARIFTVRRRQPYPNHAQPTVRSVALDDYVYATDAIAGVANGSTEVSPKPIAAWVMPSRLLVGEAVRWEIIAFHRDFRSRRQVACVRVRASNGLAQTPWQLVAATAISTSVEDANPIEVYHGDLDLAALATGDFWLEAEVYPWIGGAASVLRSEDLWAASASPRKFTRRWFRKDAGRAAAPPLAYVASSGSDAAGRWSADPAAAAASPFLTVSGAHQAIAGASATGGIADGCRIRIVDTVQIGSNAIAANNQGAACPVIERAPGTPRAAALITVANRYTPAMTCTIAGLEPNLLFYDCSLDRTTNTVGIYGASASAMLHVQLWNMRIRDAGGTFGTHLTNAHQSIFGAVFDPATTNWVWLSTSATNELRLFRGIIADVNKVSPVQWITIGCALTRAGSAVTQAPADGCIVYGNTFLALDGSKTPIAMAGAAAGETVTGVAIVQNLVEVIGTTSNPAVLLSADNANGSIVHAVLAHNTVTGFNGTGRANLFYDESSGTNRRNHRLNRLVGNIWCQINTKGDTFYAAKDAGEAPGRTGNFAYAHGVGCEGEWSQFADAAGSGFSQLYPGVGASIGTSNSVRHDPLFVDYRGTAGAASAGAGGGDYRVQSGSPARARIAMRGLAFDLAGTARPGEGRAAAGALA